MILRGNEVGSSRSRTRDSKQASFSLPEEQQLRFLSDNLPDNEMQNVQLINDQMSSDPSEND